MISSYLRHLPPVLWDPARDDEFGLATFLLAFEKILTGLDDGIPIRRTADGRTHEHEPIATIIDRIPELFDPWRVPERFLPWLASWVALEFPNLQGREIWDEYQRRRATAEIARIHRLRGLRAGLDNALDLLSTSTIRPRVAIDDGDKLLTLTPSAVGVAPITALVTQGPALSEPFGIASRVLVNGLVRPRCVAVGGDGSLFVGDFGAATQVTALISRVWRVSPSGALDLAGDPPVPTPLAPGTADFTNVVAVAVRPKRGADPETLFILDRSKKLFSLPFPYTAATATLVTTVPTVRPMAMAVDGNGDVLVLDRGNIVGDPANPRVFVVRPGQPVGAPVALTTIKEPLSLHVRADGTLVIGDGGDQNSRDPGNLIRVQRVSPTNWTQSPMLAGQNPLVSPSAVVAADGDAFYVLDAGLRPFASGEGVVTMAAPASVYRVDGTGAVRRISDHGNLVFPTGMAVQGGRLVICDPGQLESPQEAPVLTRLSPFRFCVVVHLEEDNLPEDAVKRARAIGAISAGIGDIVDRMRPAHTLGTLIIAG
ncbi:phage tail protein [Nocardia aurea]|uniref:Phage tail protein n=1 Tax=Nocardia aurea TaxID=2144174 RepID=A0ABV3G1L4_9NOCA